jgi:hypothetical protein
VHGRPGTVPAHLESLFARLGMLMYLWVECVVKFHTSFSSTVHRPKATTAAAGETEHSVRQWLEEGERPRENFPMPFTSIRVHQWFRRTDAGSQMDSNGELRQEG